MLRKVSKIGPSTLMISLPSRWVKKLGIKKGQELDILEEGDSLKVRSRINDSNDTVSIEVSNEMLLTRYLNSLYTSGCDEIKISLGGGLDVSRIEPLIEQLLGYEIVEQAGSKITIKDVARSLNKEFDSVLRRMFLINSSMGEEALLGIRSSERSRLERTIQMERTNNRFANFCMRLLNKYGYHEQNRLHTMISLVNELEKVADGYRDLCAHAVKVKETPKAFVDILSEVNKTFIEIQEVFYKFDPERAEILTKKRRALYQSLSDMASKKNAPELMVHDALYLLKII